MQKITTHYGTIPASEMIENHKNGALLSCTPIEKCTLATSLGDLVPQFTTDDVRKKEVQPVVFHESGAIKAIPLEEQTVVTTPAGETPAELITFHPNGAVSRVFPLNGKLTGYWGQEDEANLSKPVTLMTPFGAIITRIIGIGFYDNQALRSITLWPGETVSVPTPSGVIEARVGISFDRDGAIQSLEPAKPSPVKTMAGEIAAYDSDAVGINGDINSLILDKDGEVLSVATTLTRLTAVHPDGRTTVFTPEYRESLCGDSEQEIVPMLIDFAENEIKVRANPEAVATCIPFDKHVFFSEPYLPQLAQPLGMIRCSI